MQYSSIDNKYELELQHYSKIEVVANDKEIPQLNRTKFSFLQYEDLESTPINKMIGK